MPVLFLASLRLARKRTALPTSSGVLQNRFIGTGNGPRTNHIHADASHHLKVLSDADLIDSRREGQFIYNRARPETIREYSAALKKIAGLS